MYQEPLITTVTDEDIADDTQILTILQDLKKMQHNVFIKFSDAENPDNIKKMDNVRITSISENSIDIHAFFQHASMKIKNIPINNIYEIRILANKQLLAQKYKVTRWHQLDVAEVE